MDLEIGKNNYNITKLEISLQDMLHNKEDGTEEYDYDGYRYTYFNGENYKDSYGIGYDESNNRICVYHVGHGHFTAYPEDPAQWIHKEFINKTWILENIKKEEEMEPLPT